MRDLHKIQIGSKLGREITLVEKQILLLMHQPQRTVVHHDAATAVSKLVAPGPEVAKQTPGLFQNHDIPAFWNVGCRKD